MKILLLITVAISLVSCGRGVRQEQQFIPVSEAGRRVNLDAAPPLPNLPGVEVRQVPSQR